MEGGAKKEKDRKRVGDYIYIQILRERDRERETAREPRREIVRASDKETTTFIILGESPHPAQRAAFLWHYMASTALLQLQDHHRNCALDASSPLFDGGARNLIGCMYCDVSAGGCCAKTRKQTPTCPSERALSSHSTVIILGFTCASKRLLPGVCKLKNNAVKNAASHATMLSCGRPRAVSRRYHVRFTSYTVARSNTPRGLVIMTNHAPWQNLMDGANLAGRHNWTHTTADTPCSYFLLKVPV